MSCAVRFGLGVVLLGAFAAGGAGGARADMAEWGGDLAASAVVTGDPWLRWTREDALEWSSISDEFSVGRPCGFQVASGRGVYQVGACCLIAAGGASQGCEPRTADACAAAGGHFFGVGSNCTDICCPCPAGTPAEGEPDCGQPVDTVNGGCNSPGAGYPFDTVSLAMPGGTVCGTVASVGGQRDFDWFVYNHPGGDVRLCVVAEFVADLYVIAPASGTPQEQCDFAIIRAARAGSADCTEVCVTAWNEPPGVYWLVIAPSFSAGTLNCGAAYRARVAPPIRGGCCLPDGGGCRLLSGAECAGAGGVYSGDFTSCDPNPCPPCPMTCAPQAVAEGEPLCDDLLAPVNGGCDAGLVFGGQLSSGAGIVCGSSRATPFENDSDWYVVNHAGGDLGWSIRAEFAGYVRLIGPVLSPGDLCNPAYESLTAYFAASCEPLLRVRTAAPAGRYHLVVAAERESGSVACGARYELRLAGGPAGACCVAGGCVEAVEPLCLAAGGEFIAGVPCGANPCAPAVCRGDSDCDGDVDFDDIDFFVAALSGEQSWIDQHVAIFGALPSCSYANNDVDGAGGVTFDDIDPFVERIGATCD